MAKITKSIVWVGSSLVDLRKMPADVQDDIGFALWRAQEGKTHHTTKPLKGFNGVMEIIDNYKTDTYRAVYAVKLGKDIYVLHVFQKKSKKGISIPKRDMDLIRRRLQEARRMAEEEENG